MPNHPSDPGAQATPDAGAAPPEPGVQATWLGLAVIGVLIVSCFVIPFTLLRDVDEWAGSFFYWSMAAAAVIVISAFISSRWAD